MPFPRVLSLSPESRAQRLPLRSPREGAAGRHEASPQPALLGAEQTQQFMKRSGPKMEPRGTPLVTGQQLMLRETYGKPCRDPDRLHQPAGGPCPERRLSVCGRTFPWEHAGSERGPRGQGARGAPEGGGPVANGWHRPLRGPAATRGGSGLGQAANVSPAPPVSPRGRAVGGLGPGWRKAAGDTWPRHPYKGRGRQSSPSPQRPSTMRPCLLLALALLGTASARHLAAGPSKAAEPELELEPEPELEAEAEAEECPLEAETEALNITEPQSARTFRYIIVRRCQNFHTAQRVCSRCYRGRLASIHSYRTNVLLQCRARARVNNRRIWIGAITRPVGGSVFCHWSDRSGWNYAYWLHGYPLLTGRFCTTLCTANGRWRSTRCRVRLPFICEY